MFYLVKIISTTMFLHRSKYMTILLAGEIILMFSSITSNGSQISVKKCRSFSRPGSK